MKITVFYVGSSLLAPLRQAEREIESRHALGLRVAAYNFGLPLEESAWLAVEDDLRASEIVFVMHVTDGENATRLLKLLSRFEAQHRAVVVINCMPDLMRRTRMGRLRFGGQTPDDAKTRGSEEAGKGATSSSKGDVASRRAQGLVRSLGAWMGEQVRAHRAQKAPRHTQYLRLIERLPALLRLVPNAGRLRDIKHYLSLFCYFLQPTPANIRSMLLYALKNYATDARCQNLAALPPESMPAVGIYHPEAERIFDSLAAYRAWYERRTPKHLYPRLIPEQTVGLLLMRPQIVSGTHQHYDALIRALEAEGLAVIPAISTFMDNRAACESFFVEERKTTPRKVRTKSHEGDQPAERLAHVSQILSLTGFSFVGGPAMNDSEAAVDFLRRLNRPLRSAVSLDVQTIESWQASWTGLNPVQAGMQIAIPEIDGATEPFVFGGMPAGGVEPIALAERCQRIARRLARWQRLRTAAREEIKLALVIFCFPPNKGHTGTAADLDVFPSLWETLGRLKREGYTVELPASVDELRERVIGGNADHFAATTNVADRLSVDEYYRLCPFATEIENEWGPAPGALNSFGRDLLIQGVRLGNVLIAVQPTFGYEGDPMRLLMARSGAPHHGFAALYTYLEKVFRADAVAHVGTHGALEFMPGKQVGLSGSCWPDRLIGEMPHIYLYSVNNPSEGSIARRRGYAELISYLTPPVEDAGVYQELAALKELLMSYRHSADEGEREQLYALIETKAERLHFELKNS